MGLNASQFSRFLTQADATLSDLFPAVLRIGGLSYQCTGVGGDAAREFLDEGGQVPTGVRYFRISKDIMTTRPESGTLVFWTQSPGSVTKLTVMSSPDRPHETSWVLRCEPTDR